MLLKNMALVFSLLLGGCAGTQPIYDVWNHPVPAQARTLPLDRIETAIIEAGKTRNWRFERFGPGELHARQERASYFAEVAITFNSHAYSITHHASSGMKEDGKGEINGHYNMWVRNLEKDIDIQLSNAALLK